MSEKLVVDILTLDAVQCAACQYMLEAVSALPQSVKDLVEFKEWSITTPEGVEKFTSSGGRVLPTIVINGDILFESLIPTDDELFDALAERGSDELKAAIEKVRS